MHGNEHRGVGVLGSDETHGAIAHRKIIGEVDFLEGRIFSDQLRRKRAGFSLPRDLRLGIARGPSVVVARNSLQHVNARLGRQESVVAPAFGESARETRVIGMRDQPPSRLGFQSQHRSLLILFSAASVSSVVNPIFLFRFRRARRFMPLVQEIPFEEHHHE